MFESFWRHRELIVRLARRDLEVKYRGSLLGFVWLFLSPLLMLAVYAFVFSVVFQPRWEGGGGRGDFVLNFFMGLVIFNLFAECINRAPSLLLENVAYVKKVVFPLEILSWVALVSAVFNMAVGFFLWLGFYLIFRLHGPALTILFLPVVLIPFFFLIAGLEWALSSLGVFIRDFRHVVSFLTAALMFLSPIFYPLSALPRSLQRFLFLNPITYVIEQARRVALLGLSPDWGGFLIYTVISCAVAQLSFWWFSRTRKGFADVL